MTDLQTPRHPDAGQLMALARSFLLDRIPHPEPEAVLTHYLLPPQNRTQPNPLPRVYRQLVLSAQNANMKAKVIGGSIGGIDTLARVLFDFDPKQVVAAFGTDDAALFARIREVLLPSGKLRSAPNSIWPKYCRTVLSAAAFLARFENGEDFDAWADHFYRDARSMPALPLVISEEIYGVGYPLACDFLKDLGFVDYGKPDVHIRRILEGVGYVAPRATDYQLQKALAQIAEDTGVTTFHLDKLLWLIGSGKFYDHPQIGKQGQTTRNGDRFVEYVRQG